MNAVETGDLDRFCALPGLSKLTPGEARRQGPDAHWMVLDGQEPVARCSLWWTRTPPLAGHRPGLVGHYSARDGASARVLLDRACEELARHGRTIAVGPMDANTWLRYRLLTERGSEPLFFLEPDNPDDWPAHFAGNGFTALAHYSSALAEDLTIEDPRVERAERRLRERGVEIRAFRLDEFERELSRIYEVSSVSFRDNFLYTPVEESEFVEQYRPIRPHVRPELVLIAERAGAPVGFLFAIPDLAEAARGEPVDTFVIKTAAVLPGRELAGLGNVLVARAHRVGRSLGYRRAIHALMHEENNSTNLSGRYARTIRRYTLYGRPLG